MQRKLSEIAEIPKILTSTLATVSQTFDKMMPNVADWDVGNHAAKPEQQRKFSYDEDAIDYALNDDADVGDDDDDDDGGGVGEVVGTDDEHNDRYVDAASTLSDNEENGELKRDFHKLKSKLRDLTPESDYASSVSDNDDATDDDDDENDDDYADANDDNDGAVIALANQAEIDDFLTTTFTWRMRKVPKIFLNGQPDENRMENASTITDSSDDDEDELTSKSSCNDLELTVRLPAPKATQHLKQAEVPQKRGSLELAWPWADSRKIIYKQSTCHLVPRKGGIIERSKQLLAQRRLFDFNQYHKMGVQLQQEEPQQPHE